MSACAACLRENPAGAKFSAGCGIPLTLPCASGGAPAQPDAAFCIECGTALTPPSETPSLTATVSVGGELKHITVLFTDVAGSMDLQERLDPEVWAQIMGRFVSILAEGVRKYGGTVDKVTGDGIMALFGAPVVQEDDGRRAWHAAWDLTRRIGEYSDELRRQTGCGAARPTPHRPSRDLDNRVPGLIGRSGCRAGRRGISGEPSAVAPHRC
jgi:hypothetical protein